MLFVLCRVSNIHPERPQQTTLGFPLRVPSKFSWHSRPMSFAAVAIYHASNEGPVANSHGISLLSLEVQ